MGRLLLGVGGLLVLALAAGALGCAEEERGNPHAELACAACHRGGEAEEGRAAVPPEACTASGCHSDRGPATGRFATVRFRHRDHGMTGEVTSPTCGGCHTHPPDTVSLRATVDACVLCHRDEVAETETQNCRLCHSNPSHVGLTSQGAPVPHATLPSLDIGCTRCHYDVAEPRVGVSTDRCRDCHPAVEQVAARGIGKDLHPLHRGLTCASCHGETSHRVQAMSAAVSLVCSDCHGSAHGLALDAGRPSRESRKCAGCHEGVHRAQQLLVLGTALEDRAMPSAKFLAGMSCRSCHIPPEDPTEVASNPIRGQARSCAACHRPEYSRVLDWWLQGLETRKAEASSYLEEARSALRGRMVPDTATALLTGARRLLDVVDEAGGQHNLQLADRIFREVVERTAEAWRWTGEEPPPEPRLGTPPHEGLCSYCHYRSGEPWDFERMDPGFHQELELR